MSVAPSQANKNDTDETLYAPENLISDTSRDKEQQFKHERARGHPGDEGRDLRQRKKVEKKEIIQGFFAQKAAGKRRGVGKEEERNDSDI